MEATASGIFRLLCCAVAGQIELAPAECLVADDWRPGQVFGRQMRAQALDAFSIQTSGIRRAGGCHVLAGLPDAADRSGGAIPLPVGRKPDEALSVAQCNGVDALAHSRRGLNGGAIAGPP